MTNALVGDVYAKIIEEVIAASTNDFEESGVSQTTLQELQQEWQAKLSMRGVAQMPWDPKPAPPAPTPAPGLQASNMTANPAAVNGYQYDSQANGVNGGARIKQEPGVDPQYHGMANGYAQNPVQAQGGYARAQQLVQQYSGQTQSPQPNAMQQQQRGGLALPGQQARHPGLQLPGAAAPSAPSSHTSIKVEGESPGLGSGSFPQPSSQSEPSFSQTDGADDALEEWKTLLAERRAMAAGELPPSGRPLRDHVLQQAARLESGLMLPLTASRGAGAGAARPAMTPGTIAQLDGDVDEDEKVDGKDEDDENAINSDLDDSDEEGQGQMGDEDDENGDQILCTYDKVQRVKNKWKCTLKDGVMSVGGKEYVFHKATGEFEW